MILAKTANESTYFSVFNHRLKFWTLSFSAPQLLQKTFAPHGCQLNNVCLQRDTLYIYICMCMYIYICMYDVFNEILNMSNILKEYSATTIRRLQLMYDLTQNTTEKENFFKRKHCFCHLGLQLNARLIFIINFEANSTYTLSNTTTYTYISFVLHALGD